MEKTCTGTAQTFATISAIGGRTVATFTAIGLIATRTLPAFVKIGATSERTKENCAKIGRTVTRPMPSKNAPRSGATAGISAAIGVTSAATTRTYVPTGAI